MIPTEPVTELRNGNESSTRLSVVFHGLSVLSSGIAITIWHVTQEHARVQDFGGTGDKAGGPERAGSQLVICPRGCVDVSAGQAKGKAEFEKGEQ